MRLVNVNDPPNPGHSCARSLQAPYTVSSVHTVGPWVLHPCLDNNINWFRSAEKQKLLSGIEYESHTARVHTGESVCARIYCIMNVIAAGKPLIIIKVSCSSRFLSGAGRRRQLSVGVCYWSGGGSMDRTNLWVARECVCCKY